VAFLLAIGHVWWCALTRRRGPLLRACVCALLGEGIFVAANHGDCPLGPLQQRLDDPVPLFELILPRRAARLAVPVLGAVTVGGLLLLPIRGVRCRPIGHPLAAREVESDFHGYEGLSKH
jgi:hypothetical protein